MRNDSGMLNQREAMMFYFTAPLNETFYLSGEADIVHSISIEGGSSAFISTRIILLTFQFVVSPIPLFIHLPSSIIHSQLDSHTSLNSSAKEPSQ